LGGVGNHGPDHWTHRRLCVGVSEGVERKSFSNPPLDVISFQPGICREQHSLSPPI
jgi:hypothetical protein